MEVDLWVADLSTIEVSDLDILSKSELSRAEEFVYPKHRDHFLKRRVLLRKRAADYLGIPPKAVSFGYGKLGKPFVAMSKEKLFFNASFSRDQLIIGFSREGHLGVDIEYLDSEIEAELISGHFFSAPEISAIKLARGTAQSAVFFRHWCIKEAYIKFVGKGLTFPLDQVLVRSVHENPYLEIFVRKNAGPKRIDSVSYLNDIPEYGVAVLVEGESLQVNVKWMQE